MARRSIGTSSSVPSIPGITGASLAPQIEIGHHIQVIAKRQILVDGGDAQRQRVFRPANTRRPALEQDLARVYGVDARNTLYEGGLAGAVVAYKAHHFAGVTSVYMVSA